MLIVPLPGRRSSAAEHPKTLTPHIPNGTAMYGVQKFRIPGSRSQRTLGLVFIGPQTLKRRLKAAKHHVLVGIRTRK